MKRNARHRAKSSCSTASQVSCSCLLILLFNPERILRDSRRKAIPDALGFSITLASRWIGGEMYVLGIQNDCDWLLPGVFMLRQIQIQKAHRGNEACMTGSEYRCILLERWIVRAEARQKLVVLYPWRTEGGPSYFFTQFGRRQFQRVTGGMDERIHPRLNRLIVCCKT